MSLAQKRASVITKRDGFHRAEKFWIKIQVGRRRVLLQLGHLGRAHNGAGHRGDAVAPRQGHLGRLESMISAQRGEGTNFVHGAVGHQWTEPFSKLFIRTTRIFGHAIVVFAGEQALAERGKIHHAHAVFLTDREAFVFPVPLQKVQHRLVGNRSVPTIRAANAVRVFDLSRRPFQFPSTELCLG